MRFFEGLNVTTWLALMPVMVDELKIEQLDIDEAK